MSVLKGNNFHHHTITGLALAPQSVTSGTAAGTPIVAPWEKGRQITFLVAGGSIAGAADNTLVVQVQDNAGSWSNAVDKDGSALAFPDDLDNAGDLEDGMIRGTVDFSTIDSSTHKAMRILLTEAGGGATLIGAVYVISDLYSKPGGDTDSLVALQ